MIVTGWKRKPTGMGKSAIQLDITGSYISISLRFVCPVLFIWFRWSKSYRRYFRFPPDFCLYKLIFSRKLTAY